MARKRKFKFKPKKLSGAIALAVGVITSVGIGGLFISGAFLDVILLKFLPLIVHQVVGWVLVVSALLSGVFSLMK